MRLYTAPYPALTLVSIHKLNPATVVILLQEELITTHLVHVGDQVDAQLELVERLCRDLHDLFQLSDQ